MHSARLVLALLAACGAASGQTLEELVKEALSRSPDVMAAQKRYEALRQRGRAESALPDPMLSFGWNSSGNPLPGSGIGTEPIANAGFMFTQEFPYPGKRGLRVQMADKEAQAEWEAYRAAQLSVVAKLKQAYYRVQHSWSMLDVVARNRQVLERMLRTAETRYSVGKAMQPDLFRMQTQLSILETQRIQFENERRVAESQLNADLSRPLDTQIPRPPEPAVHETLPPFEEVLAHARDNSPMAVRDERMIQKSEIAVNMARKEWYPDFALTGGYYYMGSMPPMYMFRADVKLPLWGRKQRAAITEQVNTLAQSRRTFEATQQSLGARLKEDWLMAETALKLMNLYSGTVIPQATLALESSLAGYGSGAGDMAGVLTNFMTSVEYEMNYHEQMLNFHLALARLEEMAAMPLTGGHQ